MADIQEFIQMATQNLGTSESTTQSATGTILNLIQQNAAGGDFQQLLGGLTGAEGLMSAASAATGGADAGGSGGLLGGLLGKISSLFGGQAGGALGLLTQLQQSGLSADQVGPLASMFVGFAKEKVGGDVVDNLLGKVPELKNLVG